MLFTEKPFKLIVLTFIFVMGFTVIGVSADFGDTVLKETNSSEDVKTLQVKLKALGFFSGNLTGYFGTETTASVTTFQNSKGLEADGIVGDSTFAALGAKDSPNRGAEIKVASRTDDEKVKVDEAIALAESLSGTPYVWGGTTTKGFDCSGFINYVFNEKGLPSLDRTCTGMYAQGSAVSADSLERGDLVFFATYKSTPSHIGIYVGDGKFTHCGTSTGVTVSKLYDDYWNSRYLGARRVV